MAHKCFQRKQFNFLVDVKHHYCSLSNSGAMTFHLKMSLHGAVHFVLLEESLSGKKKSHAVMECI